jgi:hypothetical protein
MPITYNHFQNAQEEFWKAVLDCFDESSIVEFRKFLVPLFYLPDEHEYVSVHSSSHPINKYGRNVNTTTNMEALRITITDELDSDDVYPSDLLRYMFEETDHPIYEALAVMIGKYRQLGNYLRGDMTDSESDTD